MTLLPVTTASTLRPVPVPLCMLFAPLVPCAHFRRRVRPRDAVTRSEGGWDHTGACVASPIHRLPAEGVGRRWCDVENAASRCPDGTLAALRLVSASTIEIITITLVQDWGRSPVGRIDGQYETYAMSQEHRDLMHLLMQLFATIFEQFVTNPFKIGDPWVLLAVIS